jgi:hypothetical protein
MVAEWNLDFEERLGLYSSLPCVATRMRCSTSHREVQTWETPGRESAENLQWTRS